MGEGIVEATILKWLKKEGESIDEGDSVLEIATDKVDSEVPAPYSGVLEKILAKEGEVITIGKPIAIIKSKNIDIKSDNEKNESKIHIKPKNKSSIKISNKVSYLGSNTPIRNNFDNRFYSPLVRKISKESNLDENDLSQIPGSGIEGRLTKNDIKKYLEHKNSKTPTPLISLPISPGDEVVEMDRVRKLIAKKMVTIQNSIPQVISFVEGDVTKIVEWKTKYRDLYYKKYGLYLTYTPLLIEAIVEAIKDFPMINSTIIGDKIIKKKAINIGMAVSLPNDNLIVPVIKHADKLSLKDLTFKINDLSKRARNNNLKPDETTEATYSISNIGTFNNIMGTPMITPPQVAVMALGAIKQRPDVIKTDKGNEIAIRSKIILSHAYDHRIIDGAMGGNFANKVASILENFDSNRKI